MPVAAVCLLYCLVCRIYLAARGSDQSCNRLSLITIFVDKLRRYAQNSEIIIEWSPFFKLGIYAFSPSA
jgi:hypothetical protein